MGRDDILFEMKMSKLKGRGGAGFPTSTKWMLTAASISDEKYIISVINSIKKQRVKDNKGGKKIYKKIIVSEIIKKIYKIIYDFVW